jgi:SAM-dependent methyltransferase
MPEHPLDDYQPEPYWTRVAEEIGKRSGTSFVAGDDTPYYRYKRRRTLRRFLDTLEVRGRSVLEVGCGPGGNLLHLSNRGPSRLAGVDISPSMIQLAKRNLADRLDRVELRTIDGATLPFESRSLDLVLTVTVLQHNVDPDGFRALVAEIARVAGDRVAVIEDTDLTVIPGESAVRRPVAHYAEEFARHGFVLESRNFLRTPATFFCHRALVKAWRVLFGYRYHEGEAVSPLLQALLSASVTLAAPLDDLLPERTGLTRMIFTRRGPGS